MGSGFLRDIALRKQLEEKVREAAKTRQLAEGAVDAAKALIEKAKGIDANATEAQAALADATAAMGNKDYKAALERANESVERGKRAYGERTRQFLDSARSLLAVTKELGLDDADGLHALERAGDALAKDAFDDAIELAKKAWKRSEKVIHEHLSSSFSTAQGLIMTAKSIGKDTSTAADLLSRARSAVEANDFEMALSFTKECLDGVRADLEDEVDRHMREADEAMRTARELGIEPGNLGRLLERARSDVDRGEYDKALNSLKHAKIEGEKALGRSLESRSEEFAKLIKEAAGMGANVEPARALFRDFEKALKGGEIGKATDLARQGMQALQKAQFDRVLLTISASRDKFVAAKNAGADITPALELLNQARQALQSNRFDEALAASKRADEALDRIVREHRDVEGEIRAMQRVHGDAEAIGVDASAAKRTLERARAALAQRDTRGAFEFLRRSRDELDQAQSDRAMEVIEKAEFLLTMGERMAANLEGPSRVLEEAVTAAKGKSFGKAMELATRSRELTERAIQRAIGESVEGLRGSLQYLGEDASSVRTLLERAQSALTARDFETSFGYLQEAMRLGEGKTKDKALQFHDLLRTAVQIGIQLGVDVAGLEAGLREANAAVDRGRFGEVIALKERLLRDTAIAADNVFNLVKAKVVEARNLQIDIAEMRELLKQAKMAIGVEDYAQAFALLRECNDQAGRTVGLHKEVYNAISGAAALVAEAKKRDVNVTKVLEMLLDAKRAHEKFDHERALELAQRAKAETQKLMSSYTSAQMIIAARELLDALAKAGIEAPHVRELLDDAKGAMKDKEYEKAQDLSERAEAQVRELVHERVTMILSAAEAAIGSLEGLSLLAQEEKAIRARELLEGGELAQSVLAANEVREEIERIKKGSEASSVAIGKAKDLASEIESMNVSAPEAEKVLGQAQKAYDANKFDEALSLATRAAEALERAREEQVSGMMARFEQAIQRAKAEKVDTRSAEKLLSRARDFLREKKYRQALAIAMQAEGEAEKVGLQQDMASKAIATIEKKLGAFPGPIPDLHKILAEAKRASGDGDYVRALDMAIKTGEELSHRREVFEEGLEVGKRAQKLREVAAAMALDTSDIDALLETARGGIEGGRAEDARAAYARALNLALESVRTSIRGSLAAGRELADAGKRLGADVATAHRKLSEAKAFLDAEDFGAAGRTAREAVDAANTGVKRLVEGIMTATEENLEHSRKLGASVEKSERLLAEARTHFEAGEWDRAMKLAEESRQGVQIRLDTEKKFAEKSFEAESMIRRAKKFGIDVLEAERLLAEGIQAKKTDHEGAMRLASEALAVADRAIEAFAPSLAATLDVQSPLASEWAEATLTVTNEAKALAKDVRVKILGDAEVEGLKELPALRAKGSETMPLRIRILDSGSIPLAIQLRSLRILDGKEYHQEVIATVQVGEPPSRPEVRITAEVESRCPVCKGLIKIGFTVKRCPQCSKEMHELCATRAAKCPSCGEPLRQPPRRRASFKVG